ncbi:MAG: DUF2937 family protein [Kiloniellales bacterium]|nr:DUF2937 family protein [Kiloniellales bacterium]
MIGRILNGMIAIIGALGFAQFPAFFQQYLQRLGGRLDQARWDMQRTLDDATSAGRTLEAYIAELQTADSEAARLAARRELERLESFGALQHAYESLALAGVWQRPVTFARNFDHSIAEETLRVFEPALLMTPEALSYAAFGMVLCLFLYAGGELGARKVAFRIREGTWI